METRLITITEIDMLKGRIYGRDEYGQTMTISNHYAQPFLMVPDNGERWLVYKEGMHWFLDRRADDVGLQTPQENLEAGDGRIEIKNNLRINAKKIIINGKEFSVTPSTQIKLLGTSVGDSSVLNFKSGPGIEFHAAYDSKRDEIDIWANIKGAGQWRKINTVGGGDVEFLNSWVNYHTDFNEAQYMKDIFGWVNLRGLIKDGTIALPIFILPLDCRPKKKNIFTGWANQGLARIDVNTVGEVSVQQYAATGSNGYVSLDGIRFRTD